MDMQSPVPNIPQSSSPRPEWMDAVELVVPDGLYQRDREAPGRNGHEHAERHPGKCHKDPGTGQRRQPRACREVPIPPIGKHRIRGTAGSEASV
jgi:hypothetical protein